MTRTSCTNMLSSQPHVCMYASGWHFSSYVLHQRGPAHTAMLRILSIETNTYLSFEVRWVLSHSSDKSMQNICRRIVSQMANVALKTHTHAHTHTHTQDMHRHVHARTHMGCFIVYKFTLCFSTNANSQSSQGSWLSAVSVPHNSRHHVGLRDAQ